VRKVIEREYGREKKEDYFFLDIGSTIKTRAVLETGSAFIPTLTFLSGPAFGKEIPLIHHQLTLGRGSDCDIVIPDPSVSRKHVQISCRKTVENGEEKLQVVLRDLGSKNGTFINYAGEKRKRLQPGDKIFIGRIILKYDHRDIADQNFHAEIYRLATVDTLTSLLNKSTITKFLAEEILSNIRDRRWVSAVLVDLDGFKSLNDKYGHLMGDRILQSVANVFLTSIRHRDKIGRFGGDEFLMVLPETRLRGAAKLAERIRQNLCAKVGPEFGLETPVTASLGVASCCASKTSLENLLERADSALYRAKALGRNRTELWKKAAESGGRE
jgi:diguanylate cyclase (GGDEF)-like protein